MTGQTEQQKLDALLEQTTRLVVKDKNTVVFESSQRADVDALRAVARLQPDGPEGRCACGGNFWIHLYAGEKALGHLDHHGRMVRFTGSSSDGWLADPMSWLRWYQSRGVSGPMQDWEDDARRQVGRERALAKWREAMPDSLRPFWPQMELAAQGGGTGGDITGMREALARAYADESAQICAVFRWYASGTGRWFGFPSYEQEAAQLLLSFSTIALVKAAESADDPSVLDGAARLFCDWYFRKRPAAERNSIPTALKDRLLRRALESPIDDVRERARNTLEP